ncbi:MAG: Crp/Fnr family transcriptional regulator [Bauldia sp.]
MDDRARFDQSAAIDAALQRVLKQRQLVERLSSRGLPVDQAESLLSTMERVLDTLRQVDVTRRGPILQLFARNRLLRSLPPEVLDRLADGTTLVRFAPGQTLAPAGRRLAHVHFIESGVVAVVGSREAAAVEVGLIGREGIVGAALVFDAGPSPLSYVAQLHGEALRIEAAPLAEELEHNAELRRIFLRYSYVLELQYVAAAVANASLNVERRVARSLLMYSDRAESDELALTHQALATSMGIRRAGVTEAIHRLEGDHLIRAKRSSILVRDRDGLERMAAPFYGLAETSYASLFEELPDIGRSDMPGLAAPGPLAQPRPTGLGPVHRQ